MNRRHVKRDNFFIAQWFHWKVAGIADVSAKVALVNRLLRKLGFWVSLQPPRENGGMTNVEQRMNLWHFASQVLAYRVPGSFVELGCNEGHSSVLIQKVIEDFDPLREFHVYDSFEGLPALRPEDGDTRYGQGQMRTTREKLLANFSRYGLRVPAIHPGWFEDTLPTQLPDTICFAYLDGDLYESIKVSLQYVYPRLSRGAICVFDDYADPAVWPQAWNELPGVKRACDDFFADKPEKVTFLYSGEMSHGYFYKQ